MSLTTKTQSGSMTARDEVRQMTNAQSLLIANEALTAAGCATATTTSKAKTVNTLTFKIDGAFYSLSATDNFWTLTGGVVAVSSFQKWLLCVNSAGTASVIPGVAAATAAAVTFPAPPQGVCIAGVLTVATDATHTFTPGTTLLGAAGITATFIDGFDSSLLALITIAN